jgi:two-component system, NtrC family, sensor histidine kinase HydH
MLAFLLFSAVFAALMTALTYAHSRAALSAEIRLNLETQALTLTQQIGALLFERLQDIQGWQHLDILQEMKVGDVDKRLARFLHDVTAAYAGVYIDILCVAQGKVVAASTAALIGTPAQTPPPWLAVPYRGEIFQLTPPIPDAARPTLTFRLAIPDAFGSASLGEIQARIDWREVEQLLDQIAQGGRAAVLLDQHNQPLAMSHQLRRRAPGLVLDALRPNPAVGAHGVLELTESPFDMARVLVGYANLNAYKSLPDLGWSIAVLTPETLAFAPIRKLLLSLLAPFALLTLLAVGLALGLATRTARPLLDLTRYTREIGRDLDTPPRTVAGGHEITELCSAFNRMLDDLRRSRTDLVRASKLAAIGEMAAKLAHEVRTPLGIIRSSAQLVDRQPGLDETGHEMMGFMISECDRMNRLVTGLLDGARPREPIYHPQDLHAILHEVTAMLHERIENKGVILELNTRAHSPTVECDRDQIVQVVLNLLMNALQALPREGKLSIQTTGDRNGLQVDVEDNGPGIPATLRDDILEPFVSFRAGGIGLGLSIVREIIGLHRGRLAISDSPLGGARITFWLPRHAPGEL